MNEKFKEMAKQADFVLWDTEATWNPGDVIDWSNRYDDEFVKYSQLLILECAKIARNHQLQSMGIPIDWNGTVFVEEAIKEAFGL